MFHLQVNSAREALIYLIFGGFRAKNRNFCLKLVFESRIRFAEFWKTKPIIPRSILKIVTRDWNCEILIKYSTFLHSGVKIGISKNSCPRILSRCWKILKLNLKTSTCALMTTVNIVFALISHNFENFQGEIETFKNSSRAFRPATCEKFRIFYTNLGKCLKWLTWWVRKFLFNQTWPVEN